MNPFRAWNRFWFAPTSAKPLAALRILFGLLVLAHLGSIALDLDHWLSGTGLLQGTEARELAGPLRPSPLQWLQDPSAGRFAVAATAIVAVVFAIGWRTRIMGVLLYLGLLSIHHRMFPSVSGADVLVVVVSFYLMLSPCGAAYSLDARRAARKRGSAEAEPLIVPWAQRLIQIQISMIYFVTAMLKANGKTWLDGTALHYVLNNGEIRRFTLGLTEYPLLIHAMTLGALVIEFALAFLLWVKAARPVVMLAGLGLHMGIMVTVNIPIFGELMTACYLCFLTPPEFQGLIRFFDLRRLLGRRAAEAVRHPEANPLRADRPARPRGPRLGAGASGTSRPRSGVVANRET